MDQSRISSQSTKIERRIVEKNRRNQMKILFSKLNSLLPASHSSKDVQTLPDQIDEAINHIKSIESRLKKLEEKKNTLSGSNSSTIPSTHKRSRACTTVGTNFKCAAETLRPPQIEIHEIGTVLEVVLITGLDNQFLFYELVRILSEERADIVNGKFSVAGDSIFHVVHAEIGESNFGAAKISERLKRFVNESNSDVELQHEWWEDFEIQPEMLKWI